MDDRFNTIAGWVLFAGIVALGSSIVAGEYFHSERPKVMGYPIAGVEQEGEGAAAAKRPAITSSARHGERPVGRDSKSKRVEDAPGLVADVDDFPGALAPGVHAVDDLTAAIEHEVLPRR